MRSAEPGTVPAPAVGRAASHRPCVQPARPARVCTARTREHPAPAADAVSGAVRAVISGLTVTE
jgi:hypothetical protein